VAALLGAFAGSWSRIPAGVFTGAMLGVGVELAVLGFPQVATPPILNQALQVMVGVLVGLRITRDSMRSGARTLVPATVLAAVFLASGVAAALAAVSLTGMELVTALFAAAPGGLTEMASVGTTLGADGPAVAAIHLARLLLVIVAANLLLVRLRSGRPGTTALEEPADDPSDERWGRDDRLRLGAIAGMGIVGGVVGLALTPLPAGGVIGALLGSGAVRMMTVGAVPERGFFFLVQVFGGGVIGLGFSAEFFETLAQLAGAAVIVNSIQMLIWVVAGYLLVRAFRFDVRTATFAAAPGGMGTLLSITGETDADLVTVAFTHLFRLCATIVVVPFVVVALFVG
jgi:uncharacterized protein